MSSGPDSRAYRCSYCLIFVSSANITERAWGDSGDDGGAKDRKDGASEGVNDIRLSLRDVPPGVSRDGVSEARLSFFAAVSSDGVNDARFSFFEVGGCSVAGSEMRLSFRGGTCKVLVSKTSSLLSSSCPCWLWSSRVWYASAGQPASIDEGLLQWQTAYARSKLLSEI